MADIEITPEVLAAVGRRAAAARRRVTVKCEVCGTEFEGTLRARYCSDKCRSVAQYKAKKSELNSARVARRRAAATSGASPGLAPAALVAPADLAEAAAELHEVVADERELPADAAARIMPLRDGAGSPADLAVPAPSDPSEGGGSS